MAELKGWIPGHCRPDSLLIDVETRHSMASGFGGGAGAVAPADEAVDWAALRER